MRLRAMFTIEAAYLITYITILCGSIFKLAFSLHDSLLNDSVKLQGGIRRYQAEAFFYDSANEKIDINAIINTPLIHNDDYVNARAKEINKVFKVYYEEKKIDITSALSDTQYDSVVKIKSNAAVVRAGKKVVEIIGGIL